MSKAVPNGSTDVTTYFVLRDSTNHAPKTDVTITDIDVYYQEQGATQAAKADLTALAAANSAHADNKGYHCGNAVYRIDWPDAAFDGGVGKEVILIVVCTGCDTIYQRVLLSPPANVVSIDNNAITSGAINNGAITVDKLADNAIAAAKIAANAITDAKIDDGAITAAKIATNAITDAKINSGAITNAKFAAGAIDAAAIASNAITDAKINSGAITAAKIASDAITADKIAANAIGASELAADAVAEIADAVWDEAIGDHSGAGSTGKALSSAGSAGDPWSTALPGAYGAGTAGKIIGDNLNAKVGDVKSKTDNLPASPAAVGSKMDLADAPNATALGAIADKILGRNLAGGSDGGRTVRQALRYLRNKVSFGAKMTVYREDDSTADWTANYTTNASADPITEVDPD